MNKFPYSIIRDAMIDLFGNIIPAEDDELSFRIDIIPLIDKKKGNSTLIIYLLNL
jgi:hypothetical protein